MGDVASAMSYQSSSPSSASTTGTLSCTSTWQGPGAPPTHVYILEQGNASGTGGLLGSFSADDGLGDTSVPQWSGSQIVGQVSSGKHLRQVDGSSGTITRTDTVSASASSPTGAYVIASGGYSWAFDTRAVSITSGIETSSRKGTSITDNGTAQPVTDARGDDGSIQVDSVASSSRSGPAEWSAGTTFTANASNFQQPYYTWQASGGKVLNLGGTPMGVETQQSNNQINLDLGPVTAGLTGPVGTSTITVNVRDNYDQAVGTNTYVVTWHQPVENWQKNGATVPLAPTAYGSSNGPQPAGGQINISVQTLGEVDLSAGAHVIGGLLTAGGAYISVAALETDPILIGLAAAGGYSFGLATPPTPTIYVENGTQGQFTADVATQLAIEAGSTSGVFMPTANRMTNTLANAASTSGNYAGYFSGSAGGSLTFDATAYQLRWQQNFLGDGYGANGYTGSFPGASRYPGAIQYVFSWAYASAPPPSAH